MTDSDYKYSKELLNHTCDGRYRELKNMLMDATDLRSKYSKSTVIDIKWVDDMIGKIEYKLKL